MSHPTNGVGSIVPGLARVMDQQIQVIADADPEQYPKGLEVMVAAPGDLANLGRGLMAPGCMLVIIPVGMAKAWRDQIRAYMAQHARVGPGQVKAPGL